MARRRLPLLDSLELRAPCEERWEDLEPDASGRYCARCQRTVLDLDALSETELRGWLALSNGELCGRRAVAARPRSERLRRPSLAALTSSLTLFLSASAAVAVPRGVAPVPALSSKGGCNSGNEALATQAASQPGASAQGGAASQPPSPRAVVVQLGGFRPVATQAVLFPEGSARWGSGSEAVLQAVVEVLQHHPELQRLALRGHVSRRGRDGGRATLATQRAHAVRGWLVAHGIDAARLVVETVGSREPLAIETSARNASLNRRVEFRVLPNP